MGKQPLSADETPRTITLDGRIVPYVLRRAKRRTIGLTIDHRGLRVGAPPRASIKEIESLILRHGAWVTDKIDEWRSRSHAEALMVTDGLRLPLLGETLEVRVAVGANRFVWNGLTPPVLTLLPRSPDDAAHLLERALRKRASELFAERLALFAARMGLPLPPLMLSAARTRWGSCSLKSGIRLNWRLVHFPAHIVDYVVVHELAHLREMNHSKRFWAVVAQYCPAHRSARAELKQLAAACPRW
ncbi:MAG: SprT family zinc-dependent metalloprotease [Propionivibrio sp.]